MDFCRFGFLSLFKIDNSKNPQCQKSTVGLPSIPGQAASPTCALSTKKQVARPVNAGAESYMNKKL